MTTEGAQGAEGATRQQRWLGMAISVACLAGFVAGLWVPLRDALDEAFPTRRWVAEHAGEGGLGAWPLSDPSAQDGQVSDAEIAAALAVLSPAYPRLVKAFGGQLQLTTLAVLSAVQTSVPRELSHVVGVYIPSARRVLLARDGGNRGWTALHEVAHMLDHALGDLSARPAFADVYSHLRGDERLDNYARSHPRECFAELFARYYFSDRRRRHVAERFPAALKYMQELEARIVHCTDLPCASRGT